MTKKNKNKIKTDIKDPEHIFFILPQNEDVMNVFPSDSIEEVMATIESDEYIKEIERGDEIRVVKYEKVETYIVEYGGYKLVNKDTVS